MMRITAVLSGVLIGLASLVLFLTHIDYPATPNFDEFHYVPAARAFADGVENKNWEHPPLGKELMSLGLGIAGDRPLGWRLMSALFGALTLVAMFAEGYLLFGTLSAAWAVAAITLFNQLLYVQARIGMLDTFMFAFLIWGVVALTWAHTRPDKFRPALALMGIALGFAIACKWAAIVPWVSILGVVLLLKLKNTSSRWRSLSFAEIAGYTVAIPLFAYFVTFLPFLWITREPPYGLADILRMQPAMWDGQLRVVTQHPYMSKWYGWPWLLRPIWYAFDREPDGYVRGVLLLGNPWVMWTGMLAWACCVWDAVRTRLLIPTAIAAAYAVLYFPWAIIPRKIAFYYYYYPAGMVLSFAIVWALRRWHARVTWAYVAVAAGLFIHFFPILSAARIPGGAFVRWMWFRSWI